jgi:sulfite reductase alpha subunit-like flavoprotein
MPNSVRDEFLNLVKQNGKMTKEQTETFIKHLEKSNRYQTETWG